MNFKLKPKDYEYLAFLQEQMDERRSEEEGKIGKNERYTTEWMMLNMCWNQYLLIHFEVYETQTEARRNIARWIQEYRNKKVEELLKIK